MNSITGVLLCGGAGRRFGGEDKPLQPVAGQTLAERAIERLAPQVDDLVISANRNQTAYERLGYPVVADEMPDCGPLAGIHAVGMATVGELLFVCPGDAPQLPRNLVTRLRDALTPSVDVVIPHDGERSQHLFMLLRRRVLDSLEVYLLSGGRSVRGWLDQQTTAVVEIPEPEGFFNVNEPEQLQGFDGAGA